MNKSILLLGYDTEYTEDPDFSFNAAKKLVNIHKEFDKPATFFMLGRLVELKPEFSDILEGFDIQQHMYSHTQVKEIPGKERAVLKLNEIDEEIKKTNEIIKNVFDVDCAGVRMPYGYENGLKDNPAILEVLKKNGMKFVSSHGRSAEGLKFVEIDVQPYFYENDLLEIPFQGWHDTMFVKKEVEGSMPEMYLELFKQAVDKKLVFAPCFHPWANVTVDPKQETIRKLLSFAIENNIKVMDYYGYYKLVRDGGV